jgi:hypothetical protein
MKFRLRPTRNVRFYDNMQIPPAISISISLNSGRWTKKRKRTIYSFSFFLKEKETSIYPDHSWHDVRPVTERVPVCSWKESHGHVASGLTWNRAPISAMFLASFLFSIFFFFPRCDLDVVPMILIHHTTSHPRLLPPWISTTRARVIKLEFARGRLTFSSSIATIAACFFPLLFLFLSIFVLLYHSGGSRWNCTDFE